MEANICNNCVNVTSCMYQNESKSQMLCELHEIKENVPKQPKIKQSNKLESINGLCSTCEYKNDCKLRSSEQFIFQCEHYC